MSELVITKLFLMILHFLITRPTGRYFIPNSLPKADSAESRAATPVVRVLNLSTW